MTAPKKRAAHARRQPADVEPLALELARAIVPEGSVPVTARALVPVIERLITLRTENDDWISQREAHAVPARIRCKLTRQLAARGDDRAVILGRDHLLRRSVLDEYLKGLPRAVTAVSVAAKPVAEAHESAAFARMCSLLEQAPPARKLRARER